MKLGASRNWAHCPLTSDSCYPDHATIFFYFFKLDSLDLNVKLASREKNSCHSWCKAKLAKKMLMSQRPWVPLGVLNDKVEITPKIESPLKKPFFLLPRKKCAFCQSSISFSLLLSIIITRVYRFPNSHAKKRKVAKLHEALFPTTQKKYRL